MLTVQPVHWFVVQAAAAVNVVAVPAVAVAAVVTLVPGGLMTEYLLVASGIVVQFGAMLSRVAVLVRMVRSCPCPVPAVMNTVRPENAFAIHALVRSSSRVAVAADTVPLPVATG